MAGYRISGPARADLRPVRDYVAQDDPYAAGRLLNAFAHQFLTIAAQPRMGRPRPEIRSGLRSHVHGSYVIFYTPTDGGIRIDRILHGARDVVALFRPRS